MVKWDEDGDGDGAGVEEDGDDDLDDACDDGDGDDDDLPLWEVFSPEESGCRRGLFFSTGFRLAAAAEIWSKLPPLFLGQQGYIRGRGSWEARPNS